MMQCGSSYITGFNEPVECANYKTDLENLRNLIEKGDPKAHYELGVLYENGIGLPNDYGKAACWYRSAAELGSADAQLCLGVMYLHDYCMLTTPQANHRAAFNLFYRAAVQGNAAAQNELGNMYVSARGVARDYHEAIYWYRLAAVQGNSYSQDNLSRMYKTARGVKKNVAMAFIFEILSSEQGNISAQRNLDSSIKELSIKQISDARSIASEWRVGDSLPSYDV